MMQMTTQTTQITSPQLNIVEKASKIWREIKRIPRNIRNFFIFDEQLRNRYSLERVYLEYFGKPLNLEQPVTLNEKLQWLKLYYRNPIMTRCADKYAVRSYVVEKIGDEYLIPLLGVYESVSEIDFEKLPEKFILKVTHASARNIICKDKQHFDFDGTKRKLEKWLGKNYYKRGLEWQYKDIKPRIVCEPLLERADGRDLYDYKIYCFHGVPKFINVNVGRESSLTYMFFDTNWERIPVYCLEQPNGTIVKIARPEQLDKMLALACQVAPDVPLVRADFYVHDEKIYFGELTFTPECGYARYYPEQYDRIFGDMLNLPEKHND